MSSLSVRLRMVAQELRDIASEHSDMKFTASEEAMTWPLSVGVEYQGGVTLWCNKDDCLLDGHNSQIDVAMNRFTIAELLDSVVAHIERNAEREAEV